MVSETRSSRKLKDEDHNSKNNTKDSSVHSPNNSGVRRSSRQTSLSIQMTPSPQSTRKSKRLEKGMPPLTPPVKRKSERLEKYNTPSPLRKSDRGKKILSSGSSGSRQSAKRPTLSELKSKKGKSSIQVTIESEKSELGIKRKKPNAKACKGLFKKQCIKKIVPDFDGKLEGPDKLSCVSGDSTRERMDLNCSSSGNLDVPEAESSTCVARSQDDSINSECGEKLMHPKVVDATSPSASQSCNLLGTCVLCSKHKRIRYSSPEQELCSCGHTGEEDLGSFSTCKDRNDHGAAVTLEFGDVCAVCNKDGELLSCVGKGCKRRLHSFLQGEIIRLCQILKLSDDVTHIVRNFLEYVMKNHHVNSDSPAIVQAFQISLCWISASISKQKIDKKKSLMLAKQLLNYQCTEEQASSVYSKMRSLKRMFLQSSDNTIRDGPTNVNKDGSQFSAVICSLRLQDSQRLEKLLKNIQLKDLEAKQLAIRDKERERADQLLAEAKAQLSAQTEALGCDMTKVNSVNSGERNVCAGPSAPVERVSDQIPSAYPNEDFQIEVNKTVPDEVTRHETSNGSNKEYDKGNLPDTLVDNRDGSDEAANRELPSPVQSTVHSEATLALQDCCDLLPQQVQNQNASQIEIPPLGLITSVNPVPSNIELPVTDDIMTSVQTNNEAPVTENSEQMQPLSANVSLSCEPSPAIEVDHQIHDRVIDFSQTAEQSISQCGESLELNGNNLVTVPASRVSRGSNCELPNFAHNNVTTPQAVVSTAEQPNQTVMQMRVDMGHLDGVNYLPAHPTLFSDPLQTELENIRKETEHLERNHGDSVSRMKSDCEKEIQEIIAQIRKKYEARLQGTESEFRLKRNELDKSKSNILMNKILAEAFRLKCLDARPSGLPGVSSSSTQQLHQLSMPPPIRFNPGTPTLPPPPRPPLHQNSSPATTVQTMQHQQLSRSHSMRPTPVTNQSVSISMRSSPVANQSASGPPVKAIRNAADLFSRPPLISAITPTPNPTRLIGEIRSAAPHLQPFRPTSSNHSATSPSLEFVKEMDRRALMRALSTLPEVCSNFRSSDLKNTR